MKCFNFIPHLIKNVSGCKGEINFHVFPIILRYLQVLVWCLRQVGEGASVIHAESICSSARDVCLRSVPVGLRHTGDPASNSTNRKERLYNLLVFVFVLFFKKRVCSFRVFRSFLYFCIIRLYGEKKRKKIPEMHRGDVIVMTCVNCSIFSFHCCC